jgi:hypothetical protein
MIEAQQRYFASNANGRAFQIVHCWLKVRHCEKIISLHEVMKLQKRPSRSSTQSEVDEGGYNPTLDSSRPPAKRDRPPDQKQAKEKLTRREGGEEYMEVWGSLIQMKIEEHRPREARWNRNNLLDERKLQIEEKW